MNVYIKKDAVHIPADIGLAFRFNSDGDSR